MNYKELLLDKLLPFYNSNLLDYEFGGVFTSFKKNGKVASTDKNIWIEARALWAYSAICDAYGVSEGYIRICESIFSFLGKCALPGGRLPFIVGRKGEVKEIKENLHSECYSAFACAAFYKICGREEVKRLACVFFNYAMGIYDRMCDDGEYSSMNRFAVHSLVHYASEMMCECDTSYEVYLKKSLENMLSGNYFRDDIGILLDYKSKASEKLDNATSISIPGDSFVAAWVLMNENKNNANGREAQFAKKLLDNVACIQLQNPFDLVPLIHYINEPEKIQKYHWWPQWEALAAYRLAEKLYGEEKYTQYAEATERALSKYLLNCETNEFYCELDECANIVGEDFHGDLFHIPRALLLLDGI